MGINLCIDQRKVVKLKQKKGEIEEENENIINNFNYEEFSFEKDVNENEENQNDNNSENKNISNKSAGEKEEGNNIKEDEKEDEVDKVKSNKNDNNNNSQKDIEIREIKEEEEFLPQDNITQEKEQKKEEKNNENNLFSSFKLEKIDSINHREEIAHKEIEEKKNERVIDKGNKFRSSKFQKQMFPDIFSIIPEKVLNQCEPTELLFLSELKKMININMKERVKYSDRFCMITKENFIIYNSKENYITLKRPLAVLPINQITRVVLFKLNPKQRGYNHFYICFDKNKSTELIYMQINTFFMNNIQSGGSNQSEKMNEENEALLIFKSENEELVKKWYVVIDYLVKNYCESKRGSEKNKNENNEY